MHVFLLYTLYFETDASMHVYILFNTCTTYLLSVFRYLKHLRIFVVIYFLIASSQRRFTLASGKEGAYTLPQSKKRSGRNILGFIVLPVIAYQFLLFFQCVKVTQTLYYLIYSRSDRVHKTTCFTCTLGTSLINFYSFQHYILAVRQNEINTHDAHVL